MSPSRNTRQQGVIPRIISVDDHVIEPPDVWTSRLPAAYVDRAPRIHIAPKGEMTLVEGAWVETPGDGDEMAAWWHFEGRRYQIKRMVACPGMPPEEVTMEGVTYDDIAPGCYDPVARSPTWTSTMWRPACASPTTPASAGQMFSEIEDRTLGPPLHRGLQRLHGRRVGRRQRRAADPAVRRAAVGPASWRRLRSAATPPGGCGRWRSPSCPRGSGLPSIHTRHWDPFFRACEETGDRHLCMHIGSGTKTVSTSPDAPTVVAANLIACNSVASMIDWLFSGVFDRFPEHSVAVRRVPDRLDPVLRRAGRRHLADPSMGAERVPSARAAVALLPQARLSCFFKDTVGIDLIDRVGLDNVMFETDYPHQDGTFPNTQAWPRSSSSAICRRDDQQDRPGQRHQAARTGF
jgi:hypothetical protein